MDEEKMTIEEVLAEIEQAYPNDIFPETTAEERALVMAQFPGFIDRTSAMMGRHLARVIRRKLGAVEHVSAADRAKASANDEPTTWICPRCAQLNPIMVGHEYLNQCINCHVPILGTGV